MLLFITVCFYHTIFPENQPVDRSSTADQHTRIHTLLHPLTVENHNSEAQITSPTDTHENTHDETNTINNQNTRRR